MAARILRVWVALAAGLLAGGSAGMAQGRSGHVRGLKTRRVQCDETWAFVGVKKENATFDQRRDGFGGAWQ